MEELFVQSLMTVLVLSGIPLIAAAIVGTLVAVFQAATQIQEQTATYLLKLLALVAIMVFLGKWMVQQVTEVTLALFDAMPMLGHL